MSGTPRLDCPLNYEGLEKFFGDDAKTWPALPLLLSQICKNYRSTGNVEFSDNAKLRPVFKNEYYPDGVEQFTPFITAFARAIENKPVEAAEAATDVSTPPFMQALIAKITVPNSNPPTFKADGAIMYALGLRASSTTPAFVLTNPIKYKWGRTLIKAMMESAVKESAEASKFWSSVDSEPASESAYYRKVGQPGKLFTKKDGEEVEVQAGSEEFKKLMENPGDNCFNLGIKNAGGDGDETCYNFVTKCLSGEGVDDCKNFMQSGDYWRNAVESAKEMSPVLGQQLLNKFGFKNQSGTYQSVDEWVKGLTLAEDEALAIAGNIELIGYLRMVVSKVNSISTVSAGAEDPYWSKMGVPNASARPESTPSETFERIRSVVVNLGRSYGQTYLVPGVSIGFMSGGAASDMNSRIKAFSEGSSSSNKSSKALKGLYASLLAQLRNINRDLDSADQKEIEKLIEQVSNYEKKLGTAAIYLAEYIDLISVHGKSDTNGLVNMDNIKTFVDKHDGYFNKNQSATEQLLSVLKKLTEAVEAETK